MTRGIASRCDSARPSTTHGRLVARQMLFSIGPAMPKQALSIFGSPPSLLAAASRKLSAITSSDGCEAEG